ncbi:hypothetical protein L1D24_20855 [Vibrio brasiliensis]|uniref:hypothetical protein n=1 Tax=Vibrio brasiliensis TaxID=170652 RepID=UPI001EFEC923|nr:hypothetical protein [Vibrio brasiliensis]MCG9650987.1 hypothetical protein [Vibrio brasiliensis]
MISRVDEFVTLPETVTHKVGYVLARQRSKLGMRVFDAMTPLIPRLYYFTTMELVKYAETPNLSYIARCVINPLLEHEGYRMKCVVPERAIVDDYGHKSRQRYWGFVEI